MASLTRYAFNVDEWHRMGEVGLFDEDARVELLDGEIIQMSPIGSRHMACVNRLNRLLVVAVGDRAIVSVQNPVGLDDRSEPQPDVALLRPRPDYYAEAVPGPADVLLVVEVADTSLAWDRDAKAPRYAGAGVPACWIVDLASEEVLELTGPASGGYRDQHRAGRGDSLVVPGVPGALVEVDDVLDRRTGP